MVMLSARNMSTTEPIKPSLLEERVDKKELTKRDKIDNQNPTSKLWCRLHQDSTFDRKRQNKMKKQ